MAVVEQWKLIRSSAIEEWAKQRALHSVLSAPSSPTLESDGADSVEDCRIETTEVELKAFVTVAELLGPERPVAYEDTIHYFKVHLPERRTWAVARLYWNGRRPQVAVPLPMESVIPIAPGRERTVRAGWTMVTLDGAEQLAELQALLVRAYDTVREERTARNAED
jgi:hypothetical protein